MPLTGEQSESINVHPTAYTQFQKFGHPGKYVGAKKVTTTQVDFTGSNYGYGAVVTSGSAETVILQTIHLTGGGSIPAAALKLYHIHEMSVKKVTGGATGNVFVLKRNPKIN